MTTRATTAAALLAGVLAMAASLTADVLAQRATPAELAARVTGNWRINLDLSPQFRPTGRQGASAAPVVPRALGGLPLLAVQRGGGGAPAASADPRILAGQRAIRGLQQVPDVTAIEATAERVTFKDMRGERTYDVNNRSVRTEVGDGAEITVRSRWNNNALQQEFVFDETRVTHIFEVNAEGTRITFTLRLDNFSGTPGSQARAVYDKQ
jgi:hypothetical protein